MRKQTCKDCEHWIRTNSGWGVCPYAKEGFYINKPSWKKEGYKCKHTQARYKTNQACKRNFKELKMQITQIELEEIESEAYKRGFKKARFETLDMIQKELESRLLWDDRKLWKLALEQMVEIIKLMKGQQI